MGILEHPDVMVGFQHQYVGSADALHDQLGHVAEVGGKSEIASSRSQQISHRVLGVVRNGKRFDEQIVEFKPVARLEQPPFELLDKVGGGFLHAVKQTGGVAVPAFGK